MEHSAFGQTFEAEDKSWWFVARKKIILLLLEKFLGKKTGNAMLDYGCGTGGTSKALQQFGDVTCVDSSDIALKFCKKRGLRRLCKADIEKTQRLPFKSGTFDAVTILDTLEHIKNDAKALRELNRILKKDGLIVITVPAYMLLWGIHDELLGHKRRYSRAELVSKLEHAGFKVLKLSYAYSLLVAPLFALRQFEKLRRKRKLSLTLETPVEPLNKFLNFIMSIEAFLIKYINIPLGASIICIAKKNEL